VLMRLAFQPLGQLTLKAGDWIRHGFRRNHPTTGLMHRQYFPRPSFSKNYQSAAIMERQVAPLHRSMNPNPNPTCSFSSPIKRLRDPKTGTSKLIGGPNRLSHTV
jgi:hypothetical protein